MPQTQSIQQILYGSRGRGRGVLDPSSLVCPPPGRSDSERTMLADYLASQGESSGSSGLQPRGKREWSLTVHYHLEIFGTSFERSKNFFLNFPKSLYRISGHKANRKYLRLTEIWKNLLPAEKIYYTRTGYPANRIAVRLLFSKFFTAVATACCNCIITLCCFSSRALQERQQQTGCVTWGAARRADWIQALHPGLCAGICHGRHENTGTGETATTADAGPAASAKHIGHVQPHGRLRLRIWPPWCSDLEWLGGGMLVSKSQLPLLFYRGVLSRTNSASQGSQHRK